MLTTADMSVAIAAGFASGCLVWFMGYGVAAAFEALTAASGIPSSE